MHEDIQVPLESTVNDKFSDCLGGYGQIKWLSGGLQTIDDGCLGVSGKFGNCLGVSGKIDCCLGVASNFGGCLGGCR